MIQELVDLKAFIVAGRYEDALEIADNLGEMGKQGILRNIALFLRRLMIHLMKNQIEERLTNGWVASISDSILEIQGLNRKGNQKSYYINADEWEPYLKIATERSIRPASAEIFNGELKPQQIVQIINKETLMNFAQTLLNLTYDYSEEDLLELIDQHLAELPGAADWFTNNYE